MLIRNALIWATLYLLAWSTTTSFQSLPPTFRVNTNLQSVPVQVTDKRGNPVPDLTAADFTLLEDGHPQAIAFFEAHREPMSLAILMDASRMMDFDGKLDRARFFLSSFLSGLRTSDEVFFMPFTDIVGPFEQLTPEQRLHPPRITSFAHGGSSLYDAIASALCHMRTAKNIRQAVVVITDGVDEHSRLHFDQLLNLARSSSSQVFMVGVYSQPEYQLFRQRHKTLPIAGLRQIDNPMLVFERLAKESGADSFFPKSDSDIRAALNRISSVLKAQYTLAYYPANIGVVRKIEVKVKRQGVKVSVRHLVGAGSGSGSVHFAASGCLVSAQKHPYAWESRVTSNSYSSMTYREDFSDPRSGWPNYAVSGAAAKYVDSGYELSRHLSPASAHVQAGEDSIIDPADALIAAYGPWWTNFRASASLSVHEGSANRAGIVFDLNESGYYAFLLMPPVKGLVTFELARGSWGGARSSVIPPTSISEFDQSSRHRLSIECNRGRIILAIDNHPAGGIPDTKAEYGLVGFGIFGDHSSRLTVNDLVVNAIP